jgi:hypothetical protein
VAAQTSGNGEDFTKRDYSIELPVNYNPTTPYPVFFGGTGCGGGPPLQRRALPVNDAMVYIAGVNCRALVAPWTFS